MEDVKEYFSEYFAELFDKKRLKDDGTLKTLDEMSDEIKISKAALSNYINKKREPKISSLMTIARFFKVSPNDLLGYEGEHEQDTRAIEASLYTGLSLETIEFLHSKKDDLLFRAGVTYLIASKKNLFSKIIGYILTCLLDVVSEDDRYSTLPGISSASEEGKHYFYDIIEELPQARDQFYRRVISDEKLRERYAREMAMKCVDHEKVFNELYPYVLYREDLPPEECAKLNEEIRKEICPENYHLTLSPDTLEKMFPDAEGIDSTQELTEHFSQIDDDDFQAIYEGQCKAFWGDYYSRLTD